MEKLAVTVEVSKELQEVFVCLAKIIVESRKALKDGFQLGTDVPAVVISCAQDVIKAIDGLSGLNYAEDKKAVDAAVAIGSIDIKTAIEQAL